MRRWIALPRPASSSPTAHNFFRSARASASATSIALGDVLAAVLRGAAVEPVTGGSDQIVLAPVRQGAAVPQTLQAVEPVFSLPPVVALVSANAPTQSTEPTATTVVSGADVSNRSNGSLRESQWRGARTLGLEFIAREPAHALWQHARRIVVRVECAQIYIDGIEVANPLLLSRITPDAIERIEVIRGPQGAALYGADAISGVTNIVTRHERIGEGMPRLRVRSSFGMSGTDYSPSAAFGQDHTLSFRTGADDRTAGFNIQFGSAGEYAGRVCATLRRRWLRAVGGRSDGGQRYCTFLSPEERLTSESRDYGCGQRVLDVR